MMQDFKNQTGQNIHATSFVIADPQTRAELTNTCTAGYPIWNSDWWKEAEKVECYLLKTILGIMSTQH